MRMMLFTNLSFSCSRTFLAYYSVWKFIHYFTLPLSLSLSLRHYPLLSLEFHYTILHLAAWIAAFLPQHLSTLLAFEVLAWKVCVRNSEIDSLSVDKKSAKGIDIDQIITFYDSNFCHFQLIVHTQVYECVWNNWKSKREKGRSVSNLWNEHVWN